VFVGDHLGAVHLAGGAQIHAHPSARVGVAMPDALASFVRNSA